MRTHIITMITLTLNKLALVKADFFIKAPVHHGPGQATPGRTASPEGLTPERQPRGRAGLYSATRWDNICQEALYPHLLAIVCRPEQVAAWLPHVPHFFLCFILRNFCVICSFLQVTTNLKEKCLLLKKI
jgi:hypothetical protein